MILLAAKSLGLGLTNAWVYALTEELILVARKHSYVLHKITF